MSNDMMMMMMLRKVIPRSKSASAYLNRACGKMLCQVSHIHRIGITAPACPRFTHSHPQGQGQGNSQSQSGASFISQHSNHLELAHEGESTKLNYLWLRDHCRCSSCWNAKTLQKFVQLQDIDQNNAPAEFHVEGENLNVTWQDGHFSSYLLPWLFENDPKHSLVPKVKKILWSGESYRSLKFERVKYNDFMNEEESVKIFLRNVAMYGFAFVDEVPADLEHTQKVSERVGPIQQTLFGKMWSLEADGSRADTAYTNIALGAHTDMTYYQQTTGIQVFHCFYHDGTGGETLMEDGFYCAAKLKETDPEAYDVLSNTYIPHDYIELNHGQHLQSLGTIIRHHPLTKEIEQFRYNPYDRLTINTIPHDQITKFYQSVKALTDIVEDNANVHYEKLRPGSIIFVDNWRLMHGRKAFTGKRVVGGNYLERDTWTSRARALGVL